MRRILISLIMAAATVSAGAQGKSKPPQPDLSRIFEHARYAYVEAYNGDLGDRDIFSGDRDAIANIEKQLQDWNRYHTTFRRDEADLVFVVRRARTANSNLPVVLGPSQPPGGRSPYPRGQSGDPSNNPSNDPNGDPNRDPGAGGSGIGREVGSPDDELAVYTLDGSGALMGPLWRQSMKNGLKGAQPPLFKKLKQAIEEAYPQ